MTAAQFNKYWTVAYPGSVLIQHYFRQNYADRWFRIHSLPGSKRYADNDKEWSILLNRQNEIITDLLKGVSNFLLVSGEYACEGYTELHPLEEVESIKAFSFISLDPIDLYKFYPGEYEEGQFCTPVFCKLSWQAKRFDNLLRDMANENLRAFFLSVDNELIIAPYAGGVDIILKDTATRDIYKQKYRAWLSGREDGL